MFPGFVDGQPRDTTVGDITATGSNTYDIANSRLVSHYVLTRGTERADVTALHHVYTVGQIRDLLQTAGFIEITCYAGPDGAPFTIGDGRMLIAACRRG